ncbi:4'-phosphopantetheinyl transferase superfamily protein, partial [Acidimicrobiaceae bacterium USS-CC1]|nr:4'-phosphopantetheinyl transferase superfamily protein [Acidiferrimicrobium australe]
CLELWTRKEAYLKATGAGLSITPRSVEVAAPAGQPARIGAWAVHQLDAGPGVAAAVAVPDRQPPIPVPALAPLRAHPA